jgi:hypothetical protein
MQLDPRDQPILRGLKRVDVEATLAGLTQFMARSRWLSLTNRYAQNTIKQLKTELDNGNILSPTDLSQYIAASCLLHCCDGWSYLGRAISALLRGDPHRARHFGYYAELRGATALLATEGIGVFHTEHFAITAPNVAKALASQRATHNFVWDCLDLWSDRQSSSSLFAQIIRPYGISLENWHTPLGVASALAPHARSWFKQWGMDLRVFHDDHIARNISSYQPDGIPRTWSLDGQSVINFVRALWEALEPSPTCRFEEIDRQILRISLEARFKAYYGTEASKSAQKFEKYVKPVVEYQGLSNAANMEWLKFMTRKLNPKDLDVLVHSRRLPDDMSFSAFAVMSRAALLLRVASGSTSRLFQAADHSIDSFKFWWQQFGVDRGLWQGKASSTDLQDMYTEIVDSLTEVDNFQKNNTKVNQTLFRLGEGIPKAIITLGSCERVALWSMAP